MVQRGLIPSKSVQDSKELNLQLRYFYSFYYFLGLKRAVIIEFWYSKIIEFIKRAFRCTVGQYGDNNVFESAASHTPVLLVGLAGKSVVKVLADSYCKLHLCTGL